MSDPDTNDTTPDAQAIDAADIQEHAALQLDQLNMPNHSGDTNEEPSAVDSLPTNFELRADGIYHVEIMPRGHLEEIKVSSPLIVEALTRNHDNEDWGRLLRFVDADGVPHMMPMPMSMLSGDGNEYRSRLLSRGLEINPSRKARELLSRYIQETKPAARVRCVQNIGWKGLVFVLPDETFGGTHHETVVFQTDLAPEHRFKTKGSLEEWQENVAQLCLDNSRLIFAVCAGLAGPLLPILKEQGGGFHFEGPTSTGKTTALLVAGSVCGGGDETLGYCTTWSSTANALEATAEMHNHSLLCLDEIKQCNPRAVGQAAYSLSNGKGRGRLTSEIKIRRRFTWNLIFLSSGEISLQSLIEQNGERYYGGQAVRVCDVPSDTGKFGLFESLHNFGSASAFSNNLRAASTQYYGTALRARLNELVCQNKEVILETWEAFRTQFLGVLPENVSGEVGRVASRFALVAFAGETSRNITTWAEGVAEAAARTLFEAWLKNREGDGAKHDAEMGVRQVRAFLELHGASRFQLHDSIEGHITNRAGYQRENTATGEKEYLIFPEVFKREVCKNYNPTFIAKELEKRGHLKRKDSDKFTQVIRVRENKRLKRLYVISESILEGGDECGDEGTPQDVPF